MSWRAQRRLLLAPFVLGAVLLVAGPMLLTVYEAFLEDDLVGPARWVGLENFRTMLDDVAFWASLQATAVFVALAVPLRVGGALALALLLHRRRRGVELQRAAVVVPTALPELAAAIVLAFLLNPVYGPINGVLGALGLPTPDWLTSGAGAMATYVIVSAMALGEGFVVLLAARSLLPASLYEAARLEGASASWVFRRLTLPALAPVLAVLTVRDVGLALSGVFTAAFLITDGGPDRATLFLPVHVYDVAFEQFRYGYGAAVSLVGFALSAAVVGLAWLALRRVAAAR